MDVFPALALQLVGEDEEHGEEGKDDPAQRLALFRIGSPIQTMKPTRSETALS